MMSKVVITVCDICEDKDKPTTSYRITSDGRGKTVDLCADDAAPLEKLLEPEKAAAGTRKRRKPMGAPVASIEEIEKSKR